MGDTACFFNGFQRFRIGDFLRDGEGNATHAKRLAYENIQCRCETHSKIAEELFRLAFFICVYADAKVRSGGHGSLLWFIGIILYINCMNLQEIFCANAMLFLFLLCKRKSHAILVNGVAW